MKSGERGLNNNQKPKNLGKGGDMVMKSDSPVTKRIVERLEISK